MTWETATPWRVGEPVPGTDWVMRGVVGRGGMGIVLEVQKGQNLRAAMKVLRPTFARSREFEARFAEEVEVMARLRHPHLVEVWDCGVLADGSPFLLMELLTGRTLRAVARDRTLRITAGAVWHITGQIAAGLGYAHDDKPPVVHRDIKPENVFLHGRRHLQATVKLLDFGLAKVLGSARAPEEIAGTPRYMAPEILRNEPLSPQIDLYALAVLVYELLTERFPWRVDIRSVDALREAHLKCEPIAPSFWKSWIPKTVDDALLQALAKHPEDRPRSVAAFYEQLAELQVVDDGSAKFRTDAPTVPTVETLARGALAPSAPGPGLDAEKPPRLALRGAWLEAARSRLTDAVASFEARSETAPQGRPSPDVEPPAPPAPLRAPDAGVEPTTPSERAARGDTPMTGASAARVERRRRPLVAPIVAILTSGVVGGAAWSGWRAHEASSARALTWHAEPPSRIASATAPAVDRSAGPRTSRYPAVTPR